VARRHPTPEARRRYWDALLAPGGALDPLADVDDPEARIAAGPGGDAAAVLIRIAVREADDLSLRELRALSTADTLFHAPDAPAAVLDRARRDARRVVCDAPPADLPVGRSVFVGA
jgi:uroporphyrin-III C-methyltransferase/precorrin-2 dehydrogenase/sirohydrochlorin ferrochelatase